MGCSETKDNLATLIMYFELGNETQKEYCIKLKDNFQHEKSIKFEIKSKAELNFCIKFRVDGKLYDVQPVFSNSDEAMRDTLKKCYDLLDSSKNN